MYQAEVKKLTHFAPLWIYLILCLLLNVIIIFNNGHVDYFNDISSVAKASGQKMDESVYAKLKGVPESNAKEDVLYIANHIQPLYQNYDVDSKLTEYYRNIFSLTPQAVDIIERKYEGLQDRVDHLAEIKADMDLYAGPMTDQSYKNLFYTLLKAISGESCIIAMLLTVYLLGYERNAKTDQYFNSTKTGRKLFRCKLTVSLLASISVFLLLTVLSLSICFLHWDYSGIWDANVSSQFHTVHDLTLVKPFITLIDFTVKGYLAAVIALSTVLVMIAVLFAAIVGLLIRNNYIAGLFTLLIPALGLLVTTLAGDLKMWVLYMYSSLQPVTIWMAQPVWFSEGGFNAPCMWFEVKGLVLSSVLLSFILYKAVQLSYRKDVV